MLERNLMRLYEQFHHIDDTNVQYIQQQENQRTRSISISLAENEASYSKLQLEQQQQQQQIQPQFAVELTPWYGHPLNLYTAFVATAILVIQLMKK